MSDRDPFARAVAIALAEVREAITASFDPSDSNTLATMTASQTAENPATSPADVLIKSFARFSAALFYVNRILDEWSRSSGADKIELWQQVLARIDAGSS